MKITLYERLRTMAENTNKETNVVTRRYCAIGLLESVGLLNIACDNMYITVVTDDTGYVHKVECVEVDDNFNRSLTVVYSD